jgi:hypothetical protein
MIPLLSSLALVSPWSIVQEEAPWTQTELEEVSAEIAEEVADLRGWDFKGPVAVRVTDHAGFLAYAKERGERMSSKESERRDETIAKLLGLLAPEYDLEAESSKLLASQVGGFYDPGADTFYLMERFTGGVAKVILAHELTHALDDQHFDLDAGITRAIARGSDAGFAFAAVVEGSGTQAMQQWTLRHMGELSLEDISVAGSMGGPELLAAPPYLWKPMIGAYLQGQAFLAGGRKTVEPVRRAFEAPPRSSEQILHPEKYWKEESRDEPVEVAFELSLVPAGWEVLGEDTLGELLLALATTPLQERKGLDVSDALALMATKYTNEAASGWDGDRALLLGRGEERRLQLVTVWDAEKDAGEFAAALESVLASHVPAGRARSGAGWRPSLTPTSFSIEVDPGASEWAARTVVVTLVSAGAAAANEESAWLAPGARLPWRVTASAR